MDRVIYMRTNPACGVVTSLFLHNLIIYRVTSCHIFITNSKQ